MRIAELATRMAMVVAMIISVVPASVSLAATASTIPLNDGERQFLEKHPVITLAVDELNPPMNFRQADGSFAGAVIDYLDLVARKAGLTLLYRGSPWDEALRRAMAHEVDGVIGARFREDRKSRLNFTQPHLEVPLAMATRATFPAVKFLADFAGKRVAIVRETVRIPIVRKNCPSCAIVEVESPLEGLSLVDQGKADAFFDDLPVVQHTIETGRFSDEKIALLYYYSEAGDVRVGLRNDMPELAGIFDKAIAAITVDEHAAIRSKWFKLGLDAAVQRGIVLTPAEERWLSAHRTIRVGFGPDRMPLDARQADGKYAGVTSDYLKLLESVTGLVFDAVDGGDWEAVQAQARDRKIDVLPMLAPTPDRERFLAFTTPVVTTPTAIFAAGAVSYVNGLDALAGKTVAVIHGYGVEDELVRNWPSIRLLPVSTITEGIAAVRKGEAFAYIGSLLTTTYALTRAGVSDVRVVGETKHTYELAIGVRRDWPELASIIQKGIDAIPAADREAVLQKWIPVRFEHGFDYTALWWLGGAIAGAVAFIVQLRVMVARRTAELKATSKELRNREGQLERVLAALDLAGDGIVVTKADGCITYINQSMCKTLGVSGDVLGRPLESIGAPDRPLFDREAVQQVRRSVVQAGSWTGEFNLVTASGAAVVLLANIRQLADGGRVGVYTDVSETRRREQAQRMLERQLEQAQKREALGQLAGGIAHDFNNLIGAILGFATFIVEDSEAGSSQRSNAERIVMASKRAKDLVSRILTFARRKTGEISIFSVHDMIRESESLLHVILPSSLELKTELPETDLLLRGDRTQLMQVIMNLCSNARDAMRDRTGTVTVSVREADRNSPDVVLLTNQPLDERLQRTVDVNVIGDGEAKAVTGFISNNRRYVVLSVSDQGAGVPTEALPQIFDPFFTTKAVGEGTGLGLATTHSSVLAHEGAIVVTSTAGHGTRFDIYLPVADVPDARQAAPEPFTAARGAGARILLVDDSPDFADMMESALLRLGFSVAACDNPVRALELLQEKPGDWDALITDQVMPMMPGIELVRRVKAFRPSFPCLLMTGYSRDDVAVEAAPEGPDIVLAKPFTQDALASSLRDLLASTPDLALS